MHDIFNSDYQTTALVIFFGRGIIMVLLRVIECVNGVVYIYYIVISHVFLVVALCKKKLCD